jgi:hypothetical protein
VGKWPNTKRPTWTRISKKMDVYIPHLSLQCHSKSFLTEEQQLKCEWLKLDTLYRRFKSQWLLLEEQCRQSMKRCWRLSKQLKPYKWPTEVRLRYKEDWGIGTVSEATGSSCRKVPILAWYTTDGLLGISNYKVSGSSSGDRRQILNNKRSGPSSMNRE